MRLYVAFWWHGKSAYQKWYAMLRHPSQSYIGALHFKALHPLFCCGLRNRSFMPLSHALIFLFVSQTMCGLFLAIVFSVGHNGTLQRYI
jgi:hypothetical protein